MYVYGNFYDRHDIERVKIKLDDTEVAKLAEAYAKGEEAYDDAYEDFNEKHTSITMFVTLSALNNRLSEVGHLNGSFVADDEEWLFGIAPTAEEAKQLFAEANTDDNEDDWEV